jgi:hypothetical protein
LAVEGPLASEEHSQSQFDASRQNRYKPPSARGLIEIKATGARASGLSRS